MIAPGKCSHQHRKLPGEIRTRGVQLQLASACLQACCNTQSSEPCSRANLRGSCRLVGPTAATYYILQQHGMCIYTCKRHCNLYVFQFVKASDRAH